MTDRDAATAPRRRALQVLFFLLGLALASWVTRTPAVRDALAASTGEMGAVLFGLSAGSMAGILSSGPLVRRWGTRVVIALGLALVTGGLAVLGAATALGLAAGAFLGLLLFGLGAGCSDVAVNIEGAEVERLAQRPLMPLLHGMYSAGSVVGSVLGLLATQVGLDVVWHLVIVAAGCALAIPTVRALPSRFGREPASGRGAGEALRAQLALWSDSRIALIGCVMLGTALAEGSANDWLALLVADVHGSATAGPLAYFGFTVAQTAGRFAGTGLVPRFGRAGLVRASALSAMLGVVLVISTANPAATTAGVLLWGSGAALSFPLTISAAGDGGGDTTSRVSAVATAGYTAFLVGPPLLGSLGDHFGLRSAMVVVLALTACAAATASAVRPVRSG